MEFEEVTDLPCYSSPAIQDDFMKKIFVATYRGHKKILAPLTEKPNAPDKDGRTPIYQAAWKGSTEIVKVLAPLTENPNAPDIDGHTPIFSAAMNGHTEIVKILAPLIVNLNESKSDFTPIEYAAMNGHTDIVKILAP